MHRFFISPDALREGELRLRDGPARQIREVLRLRVGERIAVLDNSGAEYQVELTEVGREQVCGHVVERSGESREARTHLILYQCLLKADKFEWVLQKCTELGVAEFVPVISARVVATSVGRAKQTRWERITVEAAEQSSRSKIPMLQPVREWDEALADAQARGGVALIPWEQERTKDLRGALQPGEPVHLFIGPEGGLTATEVEQAVARGVQPITLGPRILRAETAGLVAASAIFFARGEWDAR